MNYKHLHYFWVVARLGSLTKAADSLNLTPQTLSGQLRQLEESFGLDLFERQGRGLVLTSAGRQVYDYAHEMFTLGSELEAMLKRGSEVGPLELRIGITDVVPKLVAYRLIEPALRLRQPVRLVCREGKAAELVEKLETHELDLVLSDSPWSSGEGKLYNHLLGESGVSFFAADSMKLAGEFPACLHRERMLMPSEPTVVRRALLTWFAQQRIAPQIVAEFDDSALQQAFGQLGVGVFAAPTAIENEVIAQFRVSVLGRTTSVRERFYAVTAERKIEHPAVVAICETARLQLFA